MKLPMAHGAPSSPLSPKDRKFLQQLLADVKEMDLPNNGDLVKSIEESLAGKRFSPPPDRTRKND